MSKRFTGTTYEEFVEWFKSDSGNNLRNQMMSYYEARGMTYEERPSPGYDRNENGRYVNSQGEELFYYTGPDYSNEHPNRAGLNADADYMTLSDIKSAFEQDRVLQQTFGSWDNYSSYIAERQNLVDTGQILDRWEQDSQLWDEQFLRALSNRGGPNAQQISTVIQAEMNRRNNVEAGVQTDLNN